MNDLILMKGETGGFLIESDRCKLSEKYDGSYSYYFNNMQFLTKIHLKIGKISKISFNDS